MLDHHSASTESSALRNQCEIDDSKPWGDRLRKLREDDRTLRFSFLNIDGFPNKQNDKKLKHFKNFCTSNHLDVIGLSETNSQWNRLGPERQPSELLAGWKEYKPRCELGYFKQTSAQGAHVYGGTAVMAFHTARDRSRTTGQDPRGMGRWSWIRLHGKEDTTIRFVSCYRPVKPSSYAGSVWAQQKALFDELDVPGNPRDIFLTNLKQEIKT